MIDQTDLELHHRDITGTFGTGDEAKLPADIPWDPPTLRLKTPPERHLVARRTVLNVPAALSQVYEIEGLIGSGRQAHVLKCRRLTDGLGVAIKLYSGSPDAVDMDLVSNLQQTEGRHVAQIFDAGHDTYDSWEVMEYFPLGTLQDLISQHPGAWEPDEVREIFNELASGVMHAHRFLAHQDLNPGHVFVRSIEPLDLVIGDFAPAHQLELSRELVSAGSSTHYMPPEGGCGEPSERVDWWAIGIIFHQLLTGRHMLADPDHPTRLLPEREALVAVVTGAYRVDDITDERWRLLVQGLTTHSAEHRWGAVEVAQWQNGDSPAVHTDGVRIGRRLGVLHLLGRSHTKLTEIAQTLRENSLGAAEFLSSAARGELRAWLRNTAVAEDVEAVFEDFASTTASPHRSVVELQLMLDPAAPVVFMNRLVTMESLTSTISQADSDDRSAQKWVNELTEQRILTLIASYQPQHFVLAEADERYRIWKPRFHRSANALLTDVTADVVDECRRRGQALLLGHALDEDASHDPVDEAAPRHADGEAPPAPDTTNGLGVPEDLLMNLFIEAWRTAQEAFQREEDQREADAERERREQESAAKAVLRQQELASRRSGIVAALRRRIVWTLALFGSLGVYGYLAHDQGWLPVVGLALGAAMLCVGAMSLIDRAVPSTLPKLVRYYPAVWGALLGATAAISGFGGDGSFPAGIVALFGAPVTLTVAGYVVGVFVLAAFVKLRPGGNRDGNSLLQSIPPLLIATVGLIEFVMTPLGLFEVVPTQWAVDLVAPIPALGLDVALWRWLLVGSLAILLPLLGVADRLPNAVTIVLQLAAVATLIILLWVVPVYLPWVIVCAIAVAIIGGTLTLVGGNR